MNRSSENEVFELVASAAMTRKKKRLIPHKFLVLKKSVTVSWVPHESTQKDRVVVCTSLLKIESFLKQMITEIENELPRET
ncbi:hypothetical protein DICVIV_07319 [Dictyocaulus viviparus]|uniref:Uncharacterized protein n=1 Tax=Dictyocaulus viviparus TaxID=29172 RepID=A0A0D8XW79_DICVI|nr:hypothetical protein DICVIV_07319 [Dictyocaulus viviparus]